MPRLYVRKTGRSSWTEDSMKRAIKAVEERTLSIRRAAQMFDVPYGTLQDRLKETNKITHPFNKEKGMCGKDWIYSFMRRYPQLSFRKPEATSLSRVTAFNRGEMDVFFNNLELLFEKYHFEVHRIYNVDETGISTVHNPGRILARKRREARQYIPPMFIFKRMRMKDGLEKNGPAGAIYKCSKSGWITEELFTEWLQHFAKYANATPEQPILLILDNHSTHSSLASYTFCRNSGIHLLSLPPHTSHRTHPLDVTFFKSLKTAYHQECDKYMKSRNYEKIKDTDIAELFGNAYNRVTTIEKALNGFKTTGIFPINRDAFCEEDFVPLHEDNNDAQNTTAPGDLPLQENTSQNILEPVGPTQKTPSPEPGPSGLSGTVPGRLNRLRNNRLSSNSSDSEFSLEEVVEDSLSDDGDKTLKIKGKPENTSFQDLCPPPVFQPRISQRKRQHSQILTSTPLKEQLENKILKKQKKEEMTRLRRSQEKLQVKWKLRLDTKEKLMKSALFVNNLDTIMRFGGGAVLVQPGLMLNARAQKKLQNIFVTFAQCRNARKQKKSGGGHIGAVGRLGNNGDACLDEVIGHEEAGVGMRKTHTFLIPKDSDTIS
ncbi:hypothetical protein NQ318_011201 [Aromia moschata]|uniref:HTH psq-type domain-containing protein n=1 Tax=Aromia moschata TaxID=1265417 RepID=A0AAV8X382_9CUCU|nr:hypothetical protein NQ318_011201 [Aromia moschata]